MRGTDRKRKTGYLSLVDLEPSFNIKSPHTPGTRKKMSAFILFNFQMYVCSTTLQSVFFYLSDKVMKGGDTGDKQSPSLLDLVF